MYFRFDTISSFSLRKHKISMPKTGNLFKKLDSAENRGREIGTNSLAQKLIPSHHHVRISALSTLLEGPSSFDPIIHNMMWIFPVTEVHHPSAIAKLGTMFAEAYHFATIRKQLEGNEIHVFWVSWGRSFSILHARHAWRAWIDLLLAESVFQCENCYLCTLSILTQQFMFR